MWRKRIYRILKWSGVTVVGLLLLLFLLPVFFPAFVSNHIKQWANTQISGQLEFSKARLSIFRHFPHLTLTLHDVYLKGAQPFEQDTLLAGSGLSFGIDIGSLFTKTTRVNRLYLDDGLLNLQVNEKGNANYSIYKASPERSSKSPDSSNTSLKISGIFLNNCALTYTDASVPVSIKARHIYYSGSGNLQESLFDLKSNLKADSLSLTFDSSAYLSNKKLQADLITRINTNTLAFDFSRNNLLINKLPIQVKGTFAFVKNGYQVDIDMGSGKTTFENLLSVIPARLAPWVAQLHLAGDAELKAGLHGAYLPETGAAPNFTMALQVKDAVIKHQGAPVPVSNLSVDFGIQLPQLNTDSLQVGLHNLSFLMGTQPTAAQIVWRGLAKPTLNAQLSSQLNLQELQQALGIPGFLLKGNLTTKLSANGGLGFNQQGIYSWPPYKMEVQLANGYYQQAGKPLGIANIALDAHIKGKGGALQQASLQCNNMEASLGEGYIKTQAIVPDMRKPGGAASLQLKLQLEDIAKALPMGDLALSGGVSLEATVAGNWPINRQKWPVMDMRLQVEGASIKTPYYAEPLQHLNARVSMRNSHSSGKLWSLQASPISFSLDNQPFTVSARVANLISPVYNIAAKGVLDIGKLYKLFAVKGYNAAGRLFANFSLSGTVEAARAGLYKQIQHSGYLRMEHIALHSPFYAQPFMAPEALLTFYNEHTQLTRSQLQYKRNTVSATGYLYNLPGYIFSDEPLKGDLHLKSAWLNVGDFMETAATQVNDSGAVLAKESVIPLPENLDITLSAKAKKLLYNGVQLNMAEAFIKLASGALQLDTCRFVIAGAHIQVQAFYKPLLTNAAVFTLQIRADSFDVQRAYKEVPLFAEMASAARYTRGRASLEYELNGKLNSHMYPIMPSLVGKGWVKLEDVQVKGLKLFNAVGKATGKDSLNNPNLKAVVINSQIANNIITLPRTRMRVFGFRPRMEGQIGLNGSLNLQFRLGLPPFGILGIPMSITGTSDKPLVKLRRSRPEDELDTEAEEAEEKE